MQSRQRNVLLSQRLDQATGDGIIMWTRDGLDIKASPSKVVGKENNRLDYADFTSGIFVPGKVASHNIGIIRRSA